VNEQQETSFSVTRTFDAPRERVWREWVEPEAFADWFGGEASEVPIETVEMDVREGGSWKATMFGGPEREEIHWAGEFVELAEPERLVMTMTDSPGEPERAVITVDLVDLGDGRTEMTMEQRGPLPPEQVEGARSGWGSFFDRMEARLAAG
jgi:uncharacterized protein YndB with AHSA1/START domain